jgi:hypothetical protein
MNMPEIDAESYNAFRTSVSGMAMQVPDRMPVEDKLAQIQIHRARVRELPEERGRGSQGPAEVGGGR